MREKVEKSRNTLFFPMICGSGGSKSRLAKAAGLRSLARWEMKNCTPLWREAHFQVKMYKTHQHRTTFGSWDVQKVRPAVARSTFPSQNAQNTPTSDHFWKLRCPKSAPRCGAKQISKSKCTKHTNLGPLLEVEMLKKCMPLWCEADFQVKSVKIWRARSTFGRSDVVSCGRRKGLCTLSKVSKTWGFCSSSNYNHHYTTQRSTTTTATILHDTTLITRHYTTVNYTTTTATLHYANYITLHSTPLRYTTLTTTATTPTTTTVHYTTLHATPLHDTTRQSITLQLQLQLCYTTLH